MDLEYNFCHTRTGCTGKVNVSEDVNNLWLISDILTSKCSFCICLWFLTVKTTYFCQILTLSCPEIQIMSNRLFLHPKLLNYWEGNHSWSKFHCKNVNDFIVLILFLLLYKILVHNVTLCVVLTMMYVHKKHSL